VEKNEAVRLCREPYRLWVEDETTVRVATLLGKVLAPRGSKPVVRVQVGRYMEKWNVFISWNAATKQAVVTLATGLDALLTAFHLEQVRKTDDGCETLNMLWDNCGAHLEKSVVEHAQRLDINLSYFPTNSPELNPVEEINRQLKAYLSNWLFWSVEELEQAIIRFFEQRGYTFNLRIENYIIPKSQRRELKQPNT
jgi:hypothetical protein